MVMKPKNQPDSSSEEEDEVTDDEIEKMDGLMACGEFRRNYSTSERRQNLNPTNHTTDHTIYK